MIPKSEFLRAVEEMAESVYDFHDRFNIKSLDSLDGEQEILDTFYSRVLLQGEEFGELCRAINKGWPDETFLEAADVLYVALGSILTGSEDAIKACDETVEKNGKKTPDNSMFSKTGKIIKK